MPYKGLESLKIQEKCIQTWAEDLNFYTAKNYAYHLIKYLDWVKRNKYWPSAEAMLKEYKKLSAVLDPLEEAWEKAAYSY